MADFPPLLSIFNFLSNYNDFVSNYKDTAVKVCITFSVITLLKLN